jgi:phage-related holin
MLKIIVIIALAFIIIKFFGGVVESGLTQAINAQKSKIEILT